MSESAGMTLPEYVCHKTVNAKQFLSKISSVSESAVDQIWEEVQANHKKLRKCQGPHVFSIPAPKPPHVPHWLCEKCGGRVDGINKAWYERGLQHGRLLCGLC